jgi:transposase
MLAEKRRQDTEECKREAIRLGTEQGYGVSETARPLGINAQRVGRWKREVDPKGRAAFSGTGRMAAAQEEWPRLRAEHQRWRMARDILQTALGCFASGSN